MSFISWKAFLMCVWLKVSIPPFTVSSSESVAQFGRGDAGAAIRLVRHERQCLGQWRLLLHYMITLISVNNSTDTYPES